MEIKCKSILNHSLKKNLISPPSVFLEVAGRIVSCYDKLYSAENGIQLCNDERTSH